jgi:hypothetical protein
MYLKVASSQPLCDPVRITMLSKHIINRAPRLVGLSILSLSFFQSALFAL